MSEGSTLTYRSWCLKCHAVQGYIGFGETFRVPLKMKATRGSYIRPGRWRKQDGATMCYEDESNKR